MASPTGANQCACLLSVTTLLHYFVLCVFLKALQFMFACQHVFYVNTAVYFHLRTSASL